MRTGLAVALLALSGCASDFEVFNQNQQEIVGFPVGTPVLVEITQRTSYKVIDGADHAAYAKYCTPKISSTHSFLPLGDVHYVSFNAASLGKGEFTLEFGDSGLLKKLSINSDASAGVDSVTGFLEKVLPFYRAPEVAAESVGPVAAVDDKADKLRDKHCLTEGTTVESIKRLSIE